MTFESNIIRENQQLHGLLQDRNDWIRELKQQLLDCQEAASLDREELRELKRSEAHLTTTIESMRATIQRLRSTK